MKTLKSPIFWALIAAYVAGRAFGSAPVAGWWAIALGAASGFALAAIADTLKRWCYGTDGAVKELRRAYAKVRHEEIGNSALPIIATPDTSADNGNELCGRDVRIGTMFGSHGLLEGFYVIDAQTGEHRQIRATTVDGWPCLRVNVATLDDKGYYRRIDGR